MNKILVIGSANIDMIMSLPSLPKIGETVTDGVFQQTFGGKGANQAVAAKRSGADVTLLCCLGDDENGRAIAKKLSDDGIDMSWAVSTSDASTGAALIMFDHQGSNYISVAPGSNYKLLPNHIAKHANHFSDFSLMILQCEIPDETLHAAFEAAHVVDIPILFNCAPARKLEKSIKPGNRYGIVVNETEAAALTNIQVLDKTSAFRAGSKLRDSGYRFAIVTMGSQGACLVSDDGEEYVPAKPVSAVDSTAAGDTFCGAFAAAYIEGSSLRKTVQFGSIAASICVQRIGAQPSIPFKREIEELMSIPTK
jgi:ribokinase